MRKYSASHYYCSDCDYIYIPKPYWLDEAYANSIVLDDTDQASRNVFNAITMIAVLYWLVKAKRSTPFVDVAGGYGLFTRLMRDAGFNYYWADKYTQNLFASGFEYKNDYGKCFAVSAFEVLEHISEPVDFIKNCLHEYKAETFIFTTEVFPNGAPPKLTDWSYFEIDTGQHIAFYSDLGLQRLANKLDMNYYSIGRIRIFTRRSFSNFSVKLVNNKIARLFIAAVCAKKFGHRRNSDKNLLNKLALETSRNMI